MEDQLLFFSPSPDMPLLPFTQYLQVKARRFQALCWSDELCPAPGFEPKSQLSSPVLPLHLPLVPCKRAICLVTRQAFEEVVRHYAGASPSPAAIGFELKGKIQVFRYEFERFCRLNPQDLPSLLKASISERIAQLLPDQFQHRLKNTMERMTTEVDSLELKLEGVKERLEADIKAHSESFNLQYQLTRKRIKHLQEASLKILFPTIYLERIQNDRLLAINWSQTPIIGQLQVKFQHLGEMFGTPMMTKMPDEEVKPGAQILKEIACDSELVILQVQMIKDLPAISNKVNFGSSATMPDLHRAGPISPDISWGQISSRGLPHPSIPQTPPFS